MGEHIRHFTEAYLKAVRPWLAGGDEEKAFFVSVRGGRLAVRTVRQIVGRVAKASGVAKTITPHTFHLTMATQIRRNHADLRHIQVILGHATITSTELNTHVLLEDLKEVVRRAHPQGRKSQK